MKCYPGFMTQTVVVSRRERLRAETLAEIKQHAEAQLAAGGPEAVSLSAISRTMRMSGPALYRYFASREALLTSLVVDSYDALAEAMSSAADEHREADPPARFRAVADAYRAWATAHPHRYQLIFASVYGSGLLNPDQTVPAAHRNMEVLLETVAGLTGEEPAPERAAPSTKHLQAWVDARPGLGDVSPAMLTLAVQAWVRLHGVVGLEVSGVFASMGIDAGELLTAEVDDMLARSRTPSMRS